MTGCSSIFGCTRSEVSLPDRRLLSAGLCLQSGRGGPVSGDPGHCRLAGRGEVHIAATVSSASGPSCPTRFPCTEPSRRRPCPDLPGDGAMINFLHKLHHGGLGLLDTHGPGAPQPERALGQEDRLQDGLDGRRLHVLWEAPCTSRASPLHQSPRRARGHGAASGADRGAGGSPRRTWAAGPWANATLEQRRRAWSSGSGERGQVRAPAAPGRLTRRPFPRLSPHGGPSTHREFAWQIQGCHRPLRSAFCA